MAFANNNSSWSFSSESGDITSRDSSDNDEYLYTCWSAGIDREPIVPDTPSASTPPDLDRKPLPPTPQHPAIPERCSLYHGAHGIDPLKFNPPILPTASEAELRSGQVRVKPMFVVSPDRFRNYAALKPRIVDGNMSPGQEIRFVGAIYMVQMCIQAGLGQALATTDAISIRFNVTTRTDLSWVVAVYTLALGSLTLPAARLGDVLGHKRLLVAGLSCTVFWSLVAGVSVFVPSSGLVLLIISRGLQGLGAAVCLPNAAALLNAAYPPGRRKDVVLTLSAATASIGLIFGATGASALALTWWPVAYWAFALILCLVAVTAHFAVPPAEKVRLDIPRDWHAAVAALDMPGAIVGLLSLMLIGFAFLQGPASDWQASETWVAVVVGVLLAILFVVVELYYASSPLVPLSGLSSGSAFVVAATACGWASFGIWLLYTWQYLQMIKGFSPLLIAACFCPVLVTGVLGALAMGLPAQKTTSPLALLASMVAFALAAALVAGVPAEQPYWGQVFASMLVAGWGMATSPPAAAALLSTSPVKKDTKKRQAHEGLAMSLVGTVAYFGLSLGIGLGDTVAHKVSGARTSGLTTQAALARGFGAGLWTGVGLGGAGALAALALVLQTRRRQKKEMKLTHRISLSSNLDKFPMPANKLDTEWG